jgi:uncharacterized protein involved in type VI secretion and phage assembly
MGGENGIRIGLVVDNQDPQNLGRVKVVYPTLDDQESDWARLVTPMAGKERGIFFRPEVDDEVLVAYEEGDPRRPYIVGSLWSTPDNPPPDDGADQNNWRFIVSRSGHRFIFNDRAGEETIEIIDKNAHHTIVIDSANQKIVVTCTEGDVEVSAANGQVTLKARTVQVEASDSVTLKANSSMKLEATGAMELKSSASLKLQAPMIELN